MKVMDAGADARHCLIQRMVQIIQNRRKCIGSIEGLGGACYQDGAGEQMPDIVMNFSGNPVSFFQRGCINFVILFFRKHPVFFFQKEIFFGAVIS